MNKAKIKGSALLFVLVTLMIVTLLANIVLQIMLNQSRISQHQVLRVRALYAAQAAMVLARQALRDNRWFYGQNYCINACPAGLFASSPPAANIISDPDLASSDIGIQINALGVGGINNTTGIIITVRYQRPGNY